MTQVVRPYRGVSADERRLERHRQLLEACLEVVDRGGVLGVTVEAVCAEAGLTKRYFYESFTDRDAVLVAACDELLSELHDAVRREVARAVTPAARARAATEALVTMLTADRRRGRLYAESTAHPGLRERRGRAIDTFTELMLTAVYPLSEEEAADPRRRLTTRLLIAGTTDLVTSWLDGSLDADRETLVATIVDLGLAANG